MPESVTDRCTRSHEYLFHFTKRPRYYANMAAIRTPAKNPEDDDRRLAQQHAANKSVPDATVNGLRPRADKQRGHSRRHDGFNDRWDAMPKAEQCRGANKRDVWWVAPANYRGAHFATFPPTLIEPCVLANSRVGDTVLDPFGGSGTTGEVATKHGRNAILLELNPDYAALARQRCGLPSAPMEVSFND